MSNITLQEINLLRSQTKQTKLYLSVYQPSTILSARVNDSGIAKGEREVAYDGSSGDWEDVISGMTVLVGTSAGLDDKGRVRVRSATSSVLVMAENSHINWADNDYLTVLNFFEINAIYPRIIQDPNDETILLFYKDYDVAYTDQNTILGSLIVMGSHYAGFLDGGSHDIYYSASGTVPVRGGGADYQWVFEGGSPSTFHGRDPGLVTYSTSGHYTTHLTVSGSSAGPVDSSYRHVSIYERPEDGTNNPILDWELSELSGDASKGGYTGKIKVNQIIDNTILRDGSLIVIFSEDWFDGTKQSIGGNSTSRENIFFVGYVIEGSITYNYRESTVEFEIGSPTEIMKQAEGFSISVQDAEDPAGEADSNPDFPSGWVLLKNMRIRRALFHYLKWHSTVMNCVDVRYIGSNPNIQFFDSDRTSLYDAVNTLMNGSTLGRAVSDRQGALFFEVPIWSSEETSNFLTNMEITSQDWMDEPNILEQMVPTTSFVELGGIAWSGSVTGTYGAFLSSIPGNAPGYRGSVERRQGLALTSQDQLNILGGDYFAHLNARYPQVSLSLIGSYCNFDIAPQEFVPFTLTADENVRGLVFTRKLFFPQSIAYSYDPTSEFLFSSLILYESTSGFAGDTIIIPDVPPTGGSEDNGGFNLPPFTVPPLPNITPTVLGVLSQQVITPDYVFASGFPATPQDYDTTIDGWEFVDGSGNTGQGAFTIPLGANHCIVSYIFRVPAGTTGGNVYLTAEYAIFDVTATPSLNSPAALVQNDQAVFIATTAAGAGYPYKAVVGDFTMNLGEHFNSGAVVQFAVGRDSSANPPDTYGASLGFVGLLIRFYL